MARLGGGADRLRHREVRLADAEVDRVLEDSAQLEDLAHAGHLDPERPVRDP